MGKHYIKLLAPTLTSVYHVAPCATHLPATLCVSRRLHYHYASPATLCVKSTLVLRTRLQQSNIIVIKKKKLPVSGFEPAHIRSQVQRL